MKLSRILGFATVALLASALAYAQSWQPLAHQPSFTAGHALLLTDGTVMVHHEDPNDGFSDWWKLQLFLYMLSRPKPAYRTREFRSYLAAQRIDVSPKDLRRFCARHGIRRDMRAGRPQTRVTAQVAAR